VTRRSVFAVGAGLAALTAVLLRRRGRQRDRVTIGFDDGSSLTFEDGSPDGDRLLAVARPAVEP
jgi:hypothetical protein